MKLFNKKIRKLKITKIGSDECNYLADSITIRYNIEQPKPIIHLELYNDEKIIYQQEITNETKIEFLDKNNKPKYMIADKNKKTKWIERRQSK